MSSLVNKGTAPRGPGTSAEFTLFESISPPQFRRSQGRGSMSSSVQVPVSQGQLGVSYLGMIWPELSFPEGIGPDHRAGRPQRGVWGDGDWIHKPMSTRGLPASFPGDGTQGRLGALAVVSTCSIAQLLATRRCRAGSLRPEDRAGWGPDRRTELVLVSRGARGGGGPQGSPRHTVPRSLSERGGHQRVAGTEVAQVMVDGLIWKVVCTGRKRHGPSLPGRRVMGAPPRRALSPGWVGR